MHQDVSLFHASANDAPPEPCHEPVGQHARRDIAAKLGDIATGHVGEDADHGRVVAPVPLRRSGELSLNTVGPEFHVVHVEPRPHRVLVPCHSSATGVDEKPAGKHVWTRDVDGAVLQDGDPVLTVHFDPAPEPGEARQIGGSKNGKVIESGREAHAVGHPGTRDQREVKG